MRKKEADVKMRILLVEKESGDRFVIKRLLESKFEIVDFANGSDAIDYVKNNSIDIALVNDYLVENLDGAMVLDQLRAKSKKRFKAVALVAYPSEAQRKYLLSAGFEEVISKPVDINEFLNLI